MRGIVTCPQPVAGEVGAQILEAGGNAFDAGLATAFTQWVSDPFMCGPGGFGIGQIWDNQSKKLTVVDFATQAGAKVQPDMWAKDKYTRSEVSSIFTFDDLRNEIGHQSVMIPTSLAGFAEIHKRFCSMPWKELLAPAIAQAKLGTKVNTALETFYQKPMPGTTITGEERVLATAACTKAFLKPDKSLYYVGDTIPLNDLANTLDIIANKGVDEFYRGDIARAIAQDMESNNGFVTLKDLQSYKPKIAEPLWGSYHGTKIAAVPAPNTGMTVLQLLALVEPFNLGSMDHNSPEYLHIITSAMSLAHKDRLEYNGDPDFVQVPVREVVLDPARIAQQQDQIRKGITTSGRNAFEKGDTTHVNVLDKQGNIFCVTHTLGWASGVVTPGLGFVFNNGMNLADPAPGKLNSIAPGKARGTNMVPTLICDSKGTPVTAVGAPGGAVIVSAVFQAIVNLLDFNMTPTEAVSASRIHCEGGKVFLEAGIRTDYTNQLEQYGHVTSKEPLALHPMMARVQIAENIEGTIRGGSDPRAGGGSVTIAY